MSRETINRQPACELRWLCCALRKSACKPRLLFVSLRVQQIKSSSSPSSLSSVRSDPSSAMINKMSSRGLFFFDQAPGTRGLTPTRVFLTARYFLILASTKRGFPKVRLQQQLVPPTRMKSLCKALVSLRQCEGHPATPKPCAEGLPPVFQARNYLQRPSHLSQSQDTTDPANSIQWIILLLYTNSFWQQFSKRIAALRNLLTS
mmetsp:Transcript_135642/g.249495  ORF Transcript_135642/g.249495 Transcript_135642/m.249495 type:complete len:204 (+) Transcript_135642:99-710(+)